MKPEAALYRWFKDHCHGAWHRIENAISSGMPDVAVLYEGKTQWIELKVGETALLRPAQHVWQMNAELQGVKTLVILQHTNNGSLFFYRRPFHCNFDGKYWEIAGFAPTLWCPRTIANAPKIHDVLFSSSP